ncbi:hypothetical protein BH10BAC3_BH10BAC3_21600 [soil metagenome]
MRINDLIMKKLIIPALFALAVMTIACSNSKRFDSVKNAKQKNEASINNGTANEAIGDFLVKIADARMMDSKEGQLAVSNGTTAEIRAYGKLMVTDQAKLMHEIKALANKRKIILPKDISNTKYEGYQSLAKETGKDFDKKFCNMMIIDHKRDLNDFINAMEIDDKEIRAFAKANLPLIESHLEKAKALASGQ